MNIERVEAHDFRSWRELDLVVERGVTLIQGANGAGKSSILDAIWFCLFGASSDAGRLIRRGTDQATVRVWVKVDEGQLCVARTVRRSGSSAKVTLALHHYGDFDGNSDLVEYADRTAATTTETQALLEEMLGVSRETLMASAFSAQGNGAAFCDAKPTERKRILGDVLGLGLWSGLHERARAEALDAKRSADAARGALELVDGAKVRLADARDAHVAAFEANMDAEEAEKTAEHDAARLAEQAEAAREARRQHQAAVEAAERARADHSRATAERTAADEALARAKDAAANAPSVDDARAAESDAIQTYCLVDGEVLAAQKQVTHHREQLAEAKRELDTEQRNRAGAIAAAESHRVMIAREETGECSRCGAPADAWKLSPLEAARAALLDAEKMLAEADEGIEAWTTRCQYLEANDPGPADSAPLRAAQAAVDEARKRLAEAETIQSLAGSIDAAQQRARDAIDRESETAEQVRVTRTALQLAAERDIVSEDAEPAYRTALAALTAAQMAHRSAAAELATAEAAAQQAERDAAAETAARERVATAERTETDRALMAAGFSPNGVPALILENSALPALEAEANRVLGELNAPVRIELRSQKLLRSRDDIADTLDIVVSMDGLEAPYETLSGGERTRVALALRAALTRLLASKRGARVRLLVVDEPAGLDAAGCEQLAQVLEELVQAGVFETVILVTHQAELADQIARVVRVERAPGGDSRLATLVAAPAPMQEAVDA